MSQPDFNPFDPISAAMGAMHGQNLLAAKDARIKQLEDEVGRLRKAGDALGDSIEIYRLKAEVDLWKLRSDNWQKLVQATKAEVERLTKANG